MTDLLYIDLFCGAGGTSTGVNTARLDGEQCAKVIACVNHDAHAIASHKANHPEALHFVEDIRTLELSPLLAHLEECREENPKALTVLWASLECTNFSKAKGGQPRDADSRTLAEHLFRYIEAIDPDYIQIENVEEFMSWGPLDERGKPVSRTRGRDYLRWVCNVRRYGYDFAHRLMNAADYGARTTRKRFFGIFAKHGLPIVFPEPTHCKTVIPGMFSTLKKWNPVKDVLDFTDEGASIFVRADLMPHHISITNVRVERLQDISDEDCIKEGVREVCVNNNWGNSASHWEFQVLYEDKFGRTKLLRGATPQEVYAALIDKISGYGTWETNPYVFVYDFELVD